MDETVFSGEYSAELQYKPAVERFNEANKGKYHIELEEVVEASYTDKISQLAQSDSLPALIQTPNIEWIKTAMIPGKLYYPMNDFLDEHPEIKELCVDSSLEYCTQENGDIISVPAITLSNVGSKYIAPTFSPTKQVGIVSVISPPSDALSVFPPFSVADALLSPPFEPPHAARDAVIAATSKIDTNL